MPIVVVPYSEDWPQQYQQVATDLRLNVRNHLAVRTVLREREDLPDQYAAVRVTLAEEWARDHGL